MCNTFTPQQEGGLYSTIGFYNLCRMSLLPTVEDLSRPEESGWLAEWLAARVLFVRA